MSDFKDMYILSNNGVKPLDVEVMPMGDSSIKVADLQDYRQEIIALSGIPSAYLGYSDTVELREQLVHANVTFATTIMDMQENDNVSLSRLIDIIAEIKKVGYRPSMYIQTTLIPPVVLILQLIEMTLSSIGNIASVFTNMGVKIDPYYFLEQYVPHINWDEFKIAAQKAKIEETTKTNITGRQNQQPPDVGY